jgi:hypothetical protein
MRHLARCAAMLAGLAAAAASVVPAAAQTKWDLYAFTGVTHPITMR